MVGTATLNLWSLPRLSTFQFPDNFFDTYHEILHGKSVYVIEKCAPGTKDVNCHLIIALLFL
jgi:hypothetical protein